MKRKFKRYNVEYNPFWGVIITIIIAIILSNICK